MCIIKIKENTLSVIWHSKIGNVSKKKRVRSAGFSLENYTSYRSQLLILLVILEQEQKMMVILVVILVVTWSSSSRSWNKNKR
jgi:hypothetical protein